MESENKICPSCGASNDPSYSYCHICGTALGDPAGTGSQGTSQYTQNFGGAGNGYGTGGFNPAEPQTIAGCPTDAVRTYVGGGKLYDKLVRTELTGSKTSWVWPIIIMALLFGSAGVLFSSLWFFWRKMTKWALIVAFCGVALYAVNCFVYLRCFQPFIQIYFEMIRDLMSSTSMSDTMLNEYTQKLTGALSSSEFMIGAAVSQILSFVNIGIGIVLSLFAVNIYKKHIGEKLPALIDSNTPVFVIAQRGGTSAAAVVLAVLAILIVEAGLTAAAFLV